MQGIQLVLTPFVWILKLFYQMFQNYGVALILFAIVVKVIMFPFQLKGKRGMIQMTMLSDKLQRLQKQCGDDKERYNREVQALYEREHVNPMGGCLWSFLPLLILIPLYAIIRQPLTYLMDLVPDLVNQIAGTLDWPNVAVAHGWITEAAEYNGGGYQQLYLTSLITPENLGQIVQSLGDAGSRLFAVNFQFLGLDLSRVPQLKFWADGINWGSIGLALIPVISAISGLGLSLISMKTNAVNSQSQEAAQSTNRTMLIISPLMALWVGFSFPAALGLYWIVQNILSMFQEYICGRMLKKDYEAAAAKRAEQERLEKEEEKRRKKQLAEERALRAKQAKEDRKKGKVVSLDKERNSPSGAVQAASRVGMRTYARGRAYDPRRYGIDPTPYRDPGAPVDEEAVEQALAKKRMDSGESGGEDV